MTTPVRVKPKVHIGKVIQNAVVFNFRNLAENTVNSDTLLQSVTRLFTLLTLRSWAFVKTSEVLNCGNLA
jgi:hypothetical protein